MIGPVIVDVHLNVIATVGVIAAFDHVHGGDHVQVHVNDHGGVNVNVDGYVTVNGF